MSDQDPESSSLEGIAVVGLSGRFPGADDLAALWRNLCAGVEGITFYSRYELAAAGVEAALLDDPRYVRAGAALRDVQGFDAGFFGFSAREAELMDPQQRLFLECCWEALENAGYDTRTWPGSIGLFAALRTGSGEAVQSLFPVFFVFLFISAMALPLDLIQTDWFRKIATANPVTYLLEAFRSLLFEGWDLGALALGFGIAATVLAVGMLAATSALKTRLVRT